VQTVQSVIGIFGLLTLAFAISENHRAVSFRQAAIGVGLTVVLAALFLKIPQLKVAFAAIGDAVNAIAEASRAGTSFVFGYLRGGPLPFELKAPGNEFVLALQALPVVLVMSVLTTLLFYWGILQPIVRGPPRRGIGAGRSRRDPDKPDHGSRASRPRRERYREARPRRHQHNGRDCAWHHGGPRCG
jgi:nucleoside permease NupC